MDVSISMREGARSAAAFSEQPGDVAKDLSTTADAVRHDGATDHQWVKGKVKAGRVTKVGLWLLLLTMVLSVAAANTGNNSLYLVIAGALSLLGVGWWTARSNVRGVELAVSVPDEVYAGAPVLVRYALRRQRPGRSANLLMLVEGARSGSLVREMLGLSRRRRKVAESRTIGPGGNVASVAERERNSQRVVSGEQQVLYLSRGVHRVGRRKHSACSRWGCFGASSRSRRCAR